jgi:hypothetical protein
LIFTSWGVERFATLLLHYARSANISMSGPLNCRSLGFARDDKGEGGASIQIRCYG